MSRKTPDFIRSFPMKKALHPATLLGHEDEWRDAPGYPRVPGSFDCPGLGRHELGEMGDNAHHCYGAGQGILYEPGLPVPETSGAAWRSGESRGSRSDRRHAGEVLHHESIGSGSYRLGIDNPPGNCLGGRRAHHASRSFDRCGPPLDRRQTIEPESSVCVAFVVSRLDSAAARLLHSDVPRYRFRRTCATGRPDVESFRDICTTRSIKSE